MLQKSNMSETAGVFFKRPTQDHYLLDISRTIGLAHTSVKRNLSYLQKQGIITEHTIRRGTRSFPVYRANRLHPPFVKNKRIYNLIQFMECGVIDFLKDEVMPRSIVLFGSYEKGEDDETSDVDLFIECAHHDLDLTPFETYLERHIELHFRKDFSVFPKELKNNIVNGVVMHGYLEAFA